MSSELREKLADYAHTAWSGWMDYLFQKGELHENGTFTIRKWAVERWKRQASTPYSELSENEKESDRKEADEMLLIFGVDDRPFLRTLIATLEGEIDQLRHALRWVSPKDELPPDCVTVEFEFYRTFGVTEWGHGYVSTNPPLDPEWHLVADGRSKPLESYQHVIRWRPI